MKIVLLFILYPVVIYTKQHYMCAQAAEESNLWQQFYGKGNRMVTKLVSTSSPFPEKWRERGFGSQYQIFKKKYIICGLVVVAHRISPW